MSFDDWFKDLKRHKDIIDSYNRISPLMDDLERIRNLLPDEEIRKINRLAEIEQDLV